MAKVLTITQADVLEALSKVMDPELGRDIVSLNMVRDVRIEGDRVAFQLVLTTPACPLRRELEKASREAVSSIPGVREVVVETRSEVPVSKRIPDRVTIPGVKNIIAVASGKGGVGKSTVAVNLALSLARTGAKAGLLDTDIYGPSIPLMMGTSEPIRATPEQKILPLENYGVKMMSVGFMLDEETPIIWRGPMVMQAVKQFLLDVVWGELDYLVIDLPPGTGDAQLTLVQTISLTGAIVVTTPQDVALIDARRAIKMFHEVKVPVLGVVENMSYFVCPHCGGKTEIFSEGGGEKTSQRYNVPFLGKIPIDPEIRVGGDSGRPIVVANPNSPQSSAFKRIAESVASRISVIDVGG